MPSFTQVLEKHGLGPEYDAIAAEFSGKEDSEANKLELEKRIIDSHMRYLLKNGDDIESIKKQRKYLLYCWHTQWTDQFTPAMRFINNHLGDRHCSDLVDTLFERIKKSKVEVQIPDAAADAAESTPTDNEKVQHMVHKAAYASTYSERFFYKSLIGLMKDAGGYANLVNELNRSPAKLAALIIPLTGTIYCAAMFTPALLFSVSLAVGVSRISGRVERTSNGSGQQIAGTVRSASDQLYYMIASLPAIVSSFNLTLAHNTLAGIRSTMRYIANEEAAPPVNNQPVIDSIALQIVAAHIANYVAEQSSQLGANYREGASKSLILKALINEIEVVGKKSLTLAEKLDEVEKLLVTTAEEPIIKNSGKNASAALACAKLELDRARKTLSSEEDQRNYNAFYGAMLPLQQYLDDYQRQWIASWRSNTEVAKIINKCVTTLGETYVHTKLDISANIRLIKTTLESLRSEAVKLHAEIPAIHAIEKAQAVLAEQCGAAPRPGVV